MPTIDLRNVELRSQQGLRTATVLEPSPQPRQRQLHRSRAEMESLIIYTLCMAAGRGLTRLEIARAIDRAKTPHFVAVLESLVERGRVYRFQTLYRGMVMYLYEVSYDAPC